jgi:hypothetical protein
VWIPALTFFFYRRPHSELVVDRDPELLLAPQVALGRLYGGVSQQELDLLEGPSGEPAELGAGPPIMPTSA